MKFTARTHHMKYRCKNLHPYAPKIAIQTKLSQKLSRGLPLLAAFAAAALLCACSSNTSKDISPVLENGSIVFSRPAPLREEVKADTPLFGFLPSIEEKDTWLSVKRSQKKIELMQGNKASLTITSDALDKLPSGVFEVIHKQRHPVWYANDDYFAHRKLDTPPEGDANRLLRGVLGEFALFLDQDLPIHSGPAKLPELGGLQLAEDDIARIYYLLEIGSTVVIE